MSKTSLKVIFSWRLLVNFFLGISSGLPLLMIGSTLQAWMTQENVNLKVIGLFALVQLPYTFKVLWSPLMDRYVPPFLGRRRGWILVCQILLAITTAALSFVSPGQNAWMVALLAVMIAFFSASQDIVFDAYRREVLTDDELGLGSSMAVNGYRIGMLIAGAFALILADRIPWHFVYLLLASTFLIFSIFTFLAPDPLEKVLAPRSLKEAVVEPFIEYFKRRGAIEILLFIILYKVGDAMASNLTTPFYLSLGFTKTDIGAIAKTFGLGATISGALLGGILMLRLGIYRSLWIFGILQGFSILCFSVLAKAGHQYSMLISAITLENFASGMGTSAFVAFMMSLTNKKFTATQYALLTSLMRIPGVILSAPTGYLALGLGWVNYFVFCTLAAIPGLLLLLRFRKWQVAPPEPVV
jgi:PAT family beta-lactamase induction signal transducer AmpG